VIGQGLALTIGGAVIGVPLALAINRVLSRVLYGVAPIEPLIALAMTATWALITVIACSVPAVRAMRQGPSTLRELM
jgi:putative ABC transport system permease protein